MATSNLPYNTDLLEPRFGGTSEDSWPSLLDAGYKLDQAYRPNSFRGLETVHVPANYGSQSSTANFGFKARQYSGIGNYPTEANNYERATYNNLDPIVYDMRVLNPTAASSLKNKVTVPVTLVSPMTFNPAGPATLKKNLL